MDINSFDNRFLESAESIVDQMNSVDEKYQENKKYDKFFTVEKTKRKEFYKTDFSYGRVNTLDIYSMEIRDEPYEYNETLKCYNPNKLKRSLYIYSLADDGNNRPYMERAPSYFKITGAFSKEEPGYLLGENDKAKAWYVPFLKLGQRMRDENDKKPCPIAGIQLRFTITRKDIILKTSNKKITYVDSIIIIDSTDIPWDDKLLPQNTPRGRDSVFRFLNYMVPEYTMDWTRQRWDQRLIEVQNAAISNGATTGNSQSPANKTTEPLPSAKSAEKESSSVPPMGEIDLFKQ